MKDFKLRIEKLLALPRSLFWNVRVFGWEGIKIPFLIANGVKLHGLRRDCIKIDSPLEFSTVTFGFGGSIGVETTGAGTLSIQGKGILRIKGTAYFGKGTALRIDNGECIIGDGFSCNRNCQIFCDHRITIGNHALLGWNVSIHDADGHRVFKNGVEKLRYRPVCVGEHVWIAANVDILKGATIGDHSIVGCRSCVVSPFHESHVILAGVPAKIVQTEVDWAK